jgi:hypothetical protein
MSGYRPFDADALIETAAAMLQIPIAPEYRRGVRDNLKTAAKMAIIVEKVKIEEAAEPAPVYRP